MRDTEALPMNSIKSHGSQSSLPEKNGWCYTSMPGEAFAMWTLPA